MRIVSKQDIQKIVDMNDIIEYMEAVFAAHASGNTVLPLRTKISIEKNNGNMLYMPAYIPGNEALGVKVVSVFPDNRQIGLQTIHSILILNNAMTGEPIALMDAELITAYRTGAVSGVAAKYLALPDAGTVSVFGVGTQARTQLEAICSVRNIKKVYVFGRKSEPITEYIEEMQKKLDVEMVIGQSEAEALRESDIIITATTSHTPVFSSREIKPGAFITAVGGYTPEMQEIPDHVMARAKIIVDAYDAALKEAGDILIPLNKGIITPKHIVGELGEVILDRVRRLNNEEIIVFKSVGIAIQDMAVAPHLLSKAGEMGLGIEVEI